MGNPITSLVFTFSCIVMMIWACNAGFLPTTSVLYLGLFQLACVPVYLAASLELIKNGDSLNGNIFLVFTTVFGGICGIGNAVSGALMVAGMPVDAGLMNIPVAWSGVVLLAAAIAMRHECLPLLFCFAGGAWTLVTSSLVGLGILPQAFNAVNEPLFLLIAVSALYLVFVDICAGGGVHLPSGPKLGTGKSKGTQRLDGEESQS